MVFPVALFRGEESKSEQPSMNHLEGHYRSYTKGPPREPLAYKEYRKKAISDIINILNEIRRLEGAIAQEMKTHDTRDQSKENKNFCQLSGDGVGSGKRTIGKKGSTSGILQGNKTINKSGVLELDIIHK
ncbi:hypothetical protein JTB14_006174 [Gonioctena quinquepunctata]|nr:hypothetical protein JTB14_006174 [Gonioctena quinquepunctata]